MKLALAFAALLPLLALSWLYFTKPAVNTAPAPAANPPVSSAAATTKKSDTSRKPSNKQSNFDLRAEQLAIQEVRERINASIAKFAKTMTPELRRDVIDAAMRAKEPAYRKLFDSWNLDSTTADAVLAIVRERATRLQDALATPDQPGDPGGANYARDSRAERDIAEAQLQTLLATERFTEFSHFEKEMHAGDLAKSQRILESPRK